MFLCMVTARRVMPVDGGQGGRRAHRSVLMNIDNNGVFLMLIFMLV